MLMSRKEMIFVGNLGVRLRRAWNEEEKKHLTAFEQIYSTLLKRIPLGKDLQSDGAGDFLEKVRHRLFVIVSYRLEREWLPVI